MNSAQSIRERYDREAKEYEHAYTDVNQRLYWLAYDHLTWTAVEAVLPTNRSLRVLDAAARRAVPMVCRFTPSPRRSCTRASASLVPR